MTYIKNILREAAIWTAFALGGCYLVLLALIATVGPLYAAAYWLGMIG